MSAEFESLDSFDKYQVYGDCLACLGYFAFNAELCGRAELERALAQCTRLTETPEFEARLNWWNSKFSNIQFAFHSNGLSGLALYGFTLKTRKGRGRPSHPGTQSRIKTFALNYFLNDIERCKSFARMYVSAGATLDVSIESALFDTHKSGLEGIVFEDQEAVDELRKKSSEGARRLVTHLRRERDAGLSRDAKTAFVKANGGKLFCQACGVEPLKVYGVEVIEAHHRIPLSKSEEGRVTEISDFIMLCPSCHRAVHRIPDCDFEALKLKLKVWSHNEASEIDSPG